MLFMGKKTNYLGAFVQNIGSILGDAFSNIVLKKALSFFAENVRNFCSAKAPHIFGKNIGTPKITCTRKVND